MYVLDTLKKNTLIISLRKCGFGKESLIYLRHKTDGGEVRVDPNKTKIFIQCPKSIILTEFKSFMGVSQHL